MAYSSVPLYLERGGGESAILGGAVAERHVHLVEPRVVGGGRQLAVLELDVLEDLGVRPLLPLVDLLALFGLGGLVRGLALRRGLRGGVLAGRVGPPAEALEREREGRLGVVPPAELEQRAAGAEVTLGVVGVDGDGVAGVHKRHLRVPQRQVARGAVAVVPERGEVSELVRSRRRSSCAGRAGQ